MFTFFVFQTRDLLSDGFHLPYGIANTKKVLGLLFDFGFTREQVGTGSMLMIFTGTGIDAYINTICL